MQTRKLSSGIYNKLMVFQIFQLFESMYEHKILNYFFLCRIFFIIVIFNNKNMLQSVVFCIYCSLFFYIFLQHSFMMDALCHQYQKNLTLKNTEKITCLFDIHNSSNICYITAANKKEIYYFLIYLSKDIYSNK